MGTSNETLTPAHVDEAGLADWRMLYRSLHTRLRTGDFATGLRLVAEVGAAAEELNHHPDLDLRYGHLNVQLTSHDAGGVTERDLTLARRISDIAAAMGVVAEPGAVQVLDVALDSPDWSAIRPFWLAVLAGDDPGLPDEVRNDAGQFQCLWFQQSGDQEPRQRFHLDVMVPAEEAQPRIAAALAAGGVLVSDAEPSFTVLADPEGNKVCVCTPTGREG